MRLGRMSEVRPIRARCGIRDECPAWLMFRSSGVLSTRRCCRVRKRIRMTIFPTHFEISSIQHLHLQMPRREIYVEN